MVYPPSRCGAGATTIEKWPEFESGPEFAAESSPPRSWRSARPPGSSSKEPPQIEAAPCWPDWSMKRSMIR